MKKITFVIWITCLLAHQGLMAQEKKVWSLEDCISYALEENITVRKTGLTNQSLEYQAAQSRAQRFPSLDASVSQGFNWYRSGNGFSNTNGSNYSVNSSVIVFNASKLTNQIKQNELDVEGGKYNLETTKESVTISILDAFLQVLFAEEQVMNSEKQVESTQEQVNLANERLNVQVISLSDFLQVKSQLGSEKLTLANATSQLAIAKVNLMQLMELPVTEGFEIAKPNMEESLNQKREPVIQSVFDTALAVKPQIKYAAINKEIAALDEKIAKAAFFPSLSASGGISTSYSDLYAGNYFNQLDDGLSPSAKLSLSIPIYQKKQAKTNVALARINYQDAELTEVDTRNQLRKNIEQACQDVLSAQVEYEASVENYTSTKESAALSDEKFAQGMINPVDFLVSKTNLITAESKLLQSKYNLIFSYKILDFYTGIPLTL
jgi:outer membrane protein